MNNELNPRSALDTPPSPAPCSPSPASSPAAKLGRPRKLDDLKRHEICALVAGGCSLREAAKYVGCGINTVRRELERNAQFTGAVRQSQMYAQLSPLRAMQQAVTKYWRAAAWMLERAYPERFARRDPASLHARQARRLLNEVIDIVRAEIPNHYALGRLARRVRVVFEDSIRAAFDSRRTSRELRQALGFFERSEKPSDASGAGDAPGGEGADIHSFLEVHDVQLRAGEAQQNGRGLSQFCEAKWDCPPPEAATPPKHVGTLGTAQE